MSNPVSNKVPIIDPKEPPQLKSSPWETLVHRLEENLQELKEILKNNGAPSKSGEEPESHVYLTRLDESPKAGQQPKRNPQVNSLPHNWVKFAVTPGEAEAIIDQVGKYDQDSQVLERLAKLERQNRRLTVLGFIYTILLLVSLLASGSLWLQLKFSGEIGQPVSQPPPKAGDPELQTGPKVASASPVLPDSSMTSARSPLEKSELPPSKPRARLSPPSAPGSDRVIQASPPTTSASPYVGSVTSNKYHYPHCKWAKTIHPSRLRGFSSVAEAQQAGYIPCPACKPPIREEGPLQAEGRSN